MRASAAGRSAVRGCPATTSSAAARAPPQASAPTRSSRQLLAAERTRAVEPIHRSFYARVEGKLKRVSDAVDDFRHSLGFSLGEAAEHVVAAGLRPLA